MISEEEAQVALLELRDQLEALELREVSRGVDQLVEGAALADLGEGRWDRVVLVLYPSRSAFLELMTSPEYAEINVDREYGVEDHVILSANQTYSMLDRARP